jgi:hypothetical protein
LPPSSVRSEKIEVPKYPSFRETSNHHLITHLTKPHQSHKIPLALLPYIQISVSNNAYFMETEADKKIGHCCACQQAVPQPTPLLTLVTLVTPYETQQPTSFCKHHLQKSAKALSR